MWKSAAVLTLVMGASACAGPDSSGPKTSSYAGVYELTTYDKNALPFVAFQNDVAKLTITDGTLTLREENRWAETKSSSVFEFASGDLTLQSAADSGIFQIVGSQITFTNISPDKTSSFSYTGTVSADGVGYTYNGISLQYRKK